MKPFLAQFKLFRNLMSMDKKFLMLFIAPSSIVFSIILLTKFYHQNSLFVLLAIFLFISSYFLCRGAFFIYDERIDGVTIFVPLLGFFSFSAFFLALYIIFMFFYDVANIF